MDETKIPTDALLCAYYPQQLLPGISAIVELRRHLAQPSYAPVTVLVWSDPGVETHFLELRYQAFYCLLRAFPWIELVFPSPKEIKSMFSPNSRVQTKARRLVKRFGKDRFAAIHYAHDLGSDYMAQSAMQAFPRAVRACFGDALGVFYTHRYYTQRTYPLGPLREWLSAPIRTLFNALWRVKRAYSLPTPHFRLDADFAIPILPCDPGGDFLLGKHLLSVERDTLNEVLAGLARCVELNDGDSYAGVHLVLLGSYCESGLTSEDGEIGLYRDSVRLHVPLGEPIRLKAHPASYGTKVQRLMETLQGQYPVTLCKEHSYPIEVMRKVAQCRSVISFSYSSVSLHYLYGSNVVHALTDALINTYFPQHTRPWVTESNSLYLSQLEMAIQLRRQQMARSEVHTSPLVLE